MIKKYLDGLVVRFLQQLRSSLQQSIRQNLIPMDVSTPALLFGSISLLLLAYTNRFFVIAKLIRDLHSSRCDSGKASLIENQIPILRKRLHLIKGMQSFGVLSFILCTVSLFALFIENVLAGKIFFVVSVCSLLISLAFALWEIFISTKALDILLEKTKKGSNEKKSNK